MSNMASVKRTYGLKSSRESSAFPTSSPQSESSSSSSSASRKRSHLDDSSVQNIPTTKKRILSGSKPIASTSFFTSRLSSSQSTAQRKPKKNTTKESNPQKQLTQLHFSIDNSVIRTCSLCSLTYTKGAPDDETLHRAHCARVQRGMEWGKEEERECKSGKISVEEIESGIKLKNGRKGRIICFRADVGGKIGSKLTTLLDSVNITLSAPALTPETLRASKAYLFLLSSESPTSGSHKEKIIGCVIAQRITTAMAIAPQTHSQREADSALKDEIVKGLPPSNTPDPSDSSSITLIPTPLPTPLGISRLFVSSSQRRLGIGTRLLTAAATTFVHGCPLDPKKGEVAFSQPTGLGGKVLEKWAGGKGRVFEET